MLICLLSVEEFRNSVAACCTLHITRTVRVAFVSVSKLYLECRAFCLCCGAVFCRVQDIVAA